MLCNNCSTTIPDNSRFCPGCGTPVSAPTCPGCGKAVKADAKFCPGCGQALKTAPAQPPQSPPIQTPAGIPSNLAGLNPGEVVLKDTGTFPVAYVKNLMTSTNGRLYLTNQRLIFKAVALQAVGGVSVAGVFIPNPADANKSRTFFGIPLSDITNIEGTWSIITIHTANEAFKFSALQNVSDWKNAIHSTMGR